MASSTPQQVATGAPQVRRAPVLNERERRWMWTADIPFLVCALAALAWLPPMRPFDPLLCLALVAVYAIAAHVGVPLRAGADAPCVQLVFVPMLFFAPLNLVPLMVIAGFAIDNLVSLRREGRSFARVIIASGTSSYSLAPVLVLAAAGAQEFTWADAPVYVAAVTAQLAYTVLYTRACVRVVFGTRAQPSDWLPPLLIDAVLSVPALCVVAVASEAPLGAVLALTAMLVTAGGFTTERSARIDERASAAESERRAVFDERVRIARELHDVVAHHVSVMGVQAGAARLVLARDPDRAREALTSIEASSRHAVTELHQLLRFLRQAGDEEDYASHVGLDQLDDLVAAVSDSALEVRVHVDGEPLALAPTVDVSAYRIVQEALTNTLKHAAASHVDVSLHYRPGELEIEIADDGRGDGASSASPGGMGLVGMRERASLHGGSLEAGPSPAGGFVVRATLPTIEAVA